MKPILIVSFLFLTSSALAQSPGPALTIASRLPGQGAKEVPPDTHLNITFSAPPSYGTTGQVRIYDAADNSLVDTIDISASPQRYMIGGTAYNAYPLLINGNVVTIYPHPNVLTYNKTYYVQMDAGVVKNDGGDFAGMSGNTAWTFTTKAAAPAASSAKLVVAADGTGDFATVQGALDFIPRGNTNPVTIFIRKGLYVEIMNFSNKANITFLGEDRLDTVIGYPNNPRLNSNRCVMQGNNCMGTALLNLTIRDTTPKMGGGNQAETIIFKGAGNLIISHCNFYSFQDTIQIDCPAYVTDCHVEGDIDFLWGTGAVFYNHCDLKELTSKDSVLVLRNAAPKHGAVLLNCKIDTAPGVTGAFLEQNQGYGDSEVVLLNCQLGPGFDPTGWKGTNTTNVHNWEYNSTNISDGQPVDVSKRAAWSKQLDKEKDAETIANYSNPAYLLGGWSPTMQPVILGLTNSADAIANITTATLSVTAEAIPAPTYQWMKDGAPVAGATEATLKIDHAPTGQFGNYTVVVTNTAGSVTSEPLTVK